VPHEEGMSAMAFGTQDDTDEVMNEINMTPLVDVMLVLLIIFIITVPVMKHAVNIDLPRATNQPQDVKPETMRLSRGRRGAYYWNESRSLPTQPLPAHAQGRSRQTAAAGACTSAVTRRCATRSVAQAMAAAQQARIRKIGFITEPKAQ
jgi:biopolymer transport protein ExbD